MGASATTPPATEPDWAEGVPGGLTEVYFQASEALSEAVEAGGKRVRVDVLVPGLHPALETQAPGSKDYQFEFAFALLPALAAYYNTTLMVFMSSGDAAFAEAQCARDGLADPSRFRCVALDDRPSPGPGECVMYVNPTNSVGDSAVVAVQDIVDAAPDALHVLVNPRFPDGGGAMGMQERERRAAFLATFAQAYCFRNLFVVERPMLEPVEKGCVVYQPGKDWRIYATAQEDIYGPGSLNRFSRINFFFRTPNDPTSEKPPRFVLAKTFSKEYGAPTRDDVSSAIRGAQPRIEKLIQQEMLKVSDTASAASILQRAALLRDVPGAAVEAAMDLLEKEHRSVLSEQKRRREEEGDAAVGEDANAAMLAKLGAQWRLIFTTGTKKTQKQFGKINYFPIKAVQTFDTRNKTIRNGIFLGLIPLLVFRGTFTWEDRRCRLGFSFDSVRVLFWIFNLPPPKEAPKAPPRFDWVYVDENICVARGAGGGMAVWSREDDLPPIPPEEKDLSAFGTGP